jgi:hypothetical protein
MKKTLGIVIIFYGKYTYTTPTMKISPLFLLLGLGLIVLPETIINIPLFPFGRADAAIVPLNKAYNHTYTDADTTATAQNNQSAVGVLPPLECAACEYLANGLNQTVLHNPKVIAFITTDIEKVCSVLPESVQAMCNNAAQSVAPMLLAHLGDFIVTEGCEDLGVCHSSIIA